MNPTTTASRKAPRNGSTAFERARRAACLNAVEAAAALGVTLAELQAYEHGDALPDAVAIMHMARLYGVSADDLIA